MEAIKPIFQVLTQRKLKEKCLYRQTENPHKKVNTVIWTRIIRTVFVDIKTLHFRVYNAAAT
jgi:hypothetical protein